MQVMGYPGSGLEISRSYYDEGVAIAVSAVLSRWIWALGYLQVFCFYYSQSDNVALFVGQILKLNLKPIPYLQHKKKWKGWDLNPQPQPLFSKTADQLFIIFYM